VLYYCTAHQLSSPPYLHLITSEMWCWSGGRGIQWNCLSCSIVYCYNGAQRYEQFLLYRVLVLLGLALLSSKRLCVFGLHGAVYMYIKKIHPSLYLLVNWAWCDWPLTWLTNHCPSVLWHCRLGHLTCKIVSEMTYYVSSGTLNTTIPYLQLNSQYIVIWMRA